MLTFYGKTEELMWCNVTSVFTQVGIRFAKLEGLRQTLCRLILRGINDGSKTEVKNDG